MPSGFSLLVYAVAAMALISVFFAYILPLFFQPTDPTATLNKSLDTAEVALGKGITETIRFNEMGFSGETFDTENRSTAFECNDAAICCNTGENCKRPVEWDARRIEIKESIDIEATVRCLFEHTLYVCKIYLGKKPAQVSISNADLKEKIDLDEEKPELHLVVKNAGEMPMFSGTIKIEVYERYLEGNNWKRRYAGTGSFEGQFEGLSPGESLERRIQLDVSYAGKYDAELKVEGENAGFDEKDLSFEAMGGSGCLAQQCDGPLMELGECKTKCHCLNCLLSSQCEEKVKQAIKQVTVAGAPKEVDLGNRQVTPMGSNLVEVILPNEYCPGSET